jgi:hypothetical protein
MYTRIRNNKLQSISISLILVEQNEFGPDRSYMDNIFTIEQITERAEHYLVANLAFADYTIAFDRVPEIITFLRTEDMKIIS